MNVFTYGTLMFPEVWQAVVGRPFATVRGELAGFAAYRVRDAVYPGILATIENEVVTGVVYLDVDGSDRRRLDEFEDDFYKRVTAPIACHDGQLRAAEAYLVQSDNKHLLTDERWSEEDFIARGDLSRFLSVFARFQRLSPDGD